MKIGLLGFCVLLVIQSTLSLKTSHIKTTRTRRPHSHPASFSTFKTSTSKSIEIIKAQSDKRNYRYVVLDNGLPVILISDPSTDKAAASMDVGNGYLNDPNDTPGLAHFLEHMLFLGTTKYPEENSYDTWLGDHGGEFNAYTSSQNTNFFFGISPSVLSDTLDRFAQFFISPLFSIGATSREMNAVDSEHGKNLQDDDWRFQRISQVIANKQCPYQKFSTGNLKTIGWNKNEKLHAMLKKMWQTYFTAPNLRLVVLGHESLDELQTLVSEKFKDVPHDHEVNTKYPCDATSVYPEKIFGSKVYFKTVRQGNMLTLAWPIPSQVGNYASRSSDYIFTLLGYSGKGGLYDTLKAKGWISNSGPGGIGASTTIFTNIAWSFELTDAGIKHTDEITQAFYTYLKVIKDTGVQKWRYDEMAFINKVSFDSKSKESPMDYVSSVSAGLRNVDPANVLVADTLFLDYDEKDIHAIIDALVPSNMIVYQYSHNLTEPLDKHEEYYKINYAVKKIPVSTLSSYSSVSDIKNFKLPERNNFIPKDLAILATTESSVPLLKQKPNIVLEQDSPRALRVWHHPDSTFKLPYGRLTFKLWSNVPYSTVRAFVLTNLYIELFNDYLEPISYQANVAGFDNSITVGEVGLEVKIAGYSSPKAMKEYSLMVFKHLNNKKPILYQGMQQRFEDIKTDMIKGYMNVGFGKPYNYVVQVGELIVLPHTSFHPTSLVATLKSITLEDVQGWQRSLFADVQIEAFCYGNLGQSDAVEIVSDIMKVFDYKTTSSSFTNPNHRTNTFSRPRVVKLEGQTKYEIHTTTPSPTNTNAVVLNYYQYGAVNKKNMLVDNLYSKILNLVAEKPIYNQLRTIEQLGYVVWSFPMPFSDVAGFVIEVQSSVYNATYLNTRIESFIPKLREHVVKLVNKKVTANKAEETFFTYVNTLVESSAQNFSTPDEQYDFQEQQILSQDFIFDASPRMINLLKDDTKINAKGFMAFFDRTFGFSNEGQGCMSIQIDPQVLPPPKAVQTPPASVNAAFLATSSQLKDTSFRPKFDDLMPRSENSKTWQMMVLVDKQNQVFDFLREDNNSTSAVGGASSTTEGPQDMLVTVNQYKWDPRTPTQSTSIRSSNLTMSSISVFTDSLALWASKPGSHLPDVLGSF